MCLYSVFLKIRESVFEGPPNLSSRSFSVLSKTRYLSVLFVKRWVNCSSNSFGTNTHYST